MIGSQDLPGCSDSTGLGCIQHLRRVCPFPTRRCVSSTTQFCSWSSLPDKASLLANPSRFNFACLSLPAPSGRTCCLKSLLLSLLLQLLQLCFPVLHLFAANPAAQLATAVLRARAWHNCRCDDTRYHLKRFSVFSQQ